VKEIGQKRQAAEWWFSQPTKATVTGLRIHWVMGEGPVFGKGIYSCPLSVLMTEKAARLQSAETGHGVMAGRLANP